MTAPIASCLVCFYIAMILFSTHWTGFIDAFELIGVQVPKDYEIGSKDPLILDCLYDIRKEENLNYLKWYFNDFPIYQWIWGQHPKPFAEWKNFVDANYFNVTNSNSNNNNNNINNDSTKKYKSFRISKPQVNLTGIYGCRIEVLVNGISKEDSKEDHLTIYEPAKSMQLETKLDNNTGEMEITCNATGLRPQPEMQIQTNNRRLNEEKQSINSPMIELKEDETYEIMAVWTVNLSRLNESTTFNCTVSVPSTRYRRSELKRYEVAGTNNITIDAVTVAPFSNSTESLKSGASEAIKSIQTATTYLLILLTTIRLVSWS